MAVALVVVFSTSCGIRIGTESAAESAEQKLTQGPSKLRNRLTHESSPYLLQHAHNPVDWYPWGPEAFAKARAENKPIFLSIGYSSCFWCHVMEREVFENEEIAAYMNQNFVNIKVDREERPEIDEIYMLGLQVYLQMVGSSQGGGWPLSLFLTPNGDPIAGGTYFPPEDLPGRPGFKNVMTQLTTIWQTRREDVERTAAMISQEVRRLSLPHGTKTPATLDEKSVQLSVAAIRESYDPEFGGFDFDPSNPDAAKFPVPSKLLLIQSQIARNGSEAEELRRELRHTLDAMARGGIYDQLGGGFHRYSTDRRWRVPHFEKMLYDNAQLAEVYTNEYERTRRDQDRVVVEETLEFVRRELLDPRGGFYSSLDAETEGVEGKFYIWSKDELKAALSPSDYPLFEAAYGLNEDSELKEGHVLFQPAPLSDVARAFNLPLGELSKRLSLMKQQLRTVRSHRTPLRRDDKILTSWNGLMIRAFARAGKVFGREDYVTIAEKAATDILTRSRDRDGRLLRVPFREGKALLANLDDYAFLTSGLLALYEATQATQWLNTARRLTETELALFGDARQKGFYFTAHDHESLIARTKSAYDSALPSGNSVTIRNLVQLATWTSDRKYLQVARPTLEVFASQHSQSPGSLAFFSLGLDEYLRKAGPIQIDLASSSPASSTQRTSPESTPKRPASSPAPPATPKAEHIAENENVLIAGLIPEAAETAQHPRVDVVGLFGFAHAGRGAKCPVAVVIQIASGWHINANPAQPKFIIPTEITLKSPEGLQLTEVQYPAGQALELQGIDQPLSVYEGTVIVRGVLTIPQDAAEVLPIVLHLKYQACDHQSCEMPLTMTLSGSLKVADSPGAAQNHRVFGSQDNVE